MSAEEEIDRHILKKYEIQQKLGKGAYGVVWKAIDRKTKEVIALKKIFDAFQNATDAQRTFREVMFLQDLNNHEHIISLALAPVTLQAAERPVYQLFKSLFYMHSGELLHRDIKVRGCILGELLLGKPIFPGTSTMNQLDRIMELTGKPSQEDIEAVDSPFAPTMMESCTVSHAKRLADIFPTASRDALDLLRHLLVFNPSKRLTAQQALEHPYVAQFHNPAEEIACPVNIVLPISDNTKYTVVEYRDRLYAEILKKKREIQRKMREVETAQLRSQQQQQPSGRVTPSTHYSSGREPGQRK
ncbi:MAG: hypothetical protein WDW38_008862 [Sanguina aurantia]